VLNTIKQSTLNSCCKNGNSAISKSYKKYFDFQSNITGSLDIDKCLKSQYPQDNRWDYLVLNSSNIEGYFVEIHPTTTSKVSTMIRKKNWLQDKIINVYFQSINKNNYKIVWIATNGINITKSSSQMRKLNQAGLKPVRKLSI